MFQLLVKGYCQYLTAANKSLRFTPNNVGAKCIGLYRAQNLKQRQIFLNLKILL